MAPYGGSDPTQLHNLAALMMLAPAHDLSSVGLSEGRSGSAMNQMSLFSSGLRSLSEGGRSGVGVASGGGAGSFLISRERGRRSVLRRLEVLLPPSLMLPQVFTGSD